MEEGGGVESEWRLQQARWRDSREDGHEIEGMDETRSADGNRDIERKWRGEGEFIQVLAMQASTGDLNPPPAPTLIESISHEQRARDKYITVTGGNTFSRSQRRTMDAVGVC